MKSQIKIAILTVATITVALVALQPLLPVVQERFSEIAILGPNMTIGDYPRNITVDQYFLLYGIVSNHEGNVQSYEVMAKLGNQTTSVSNSTYASAPLLQKYWKILPKEETWLFPMNLTIDRPGTNLRLIFELWSFNPSSASFEYSGLWNQVWINATIA